MSGFPAAGNLAGKLQFFRAIAAAPPVNLHGLCSMLHTNSLSARRREFFSPEQGSHRSGQGTHPTGFATPIYLTSPANHGLGPVARGQVRQTPWNFSLSINSPITIIIVRF